MTSQGFPSMVIFALTSKVASWHNLYSVLGDNASSWNITFGISEYPSSFDGNTSYAFLEYPRLLFECCSCTLPPSLTLSSPSPG